MIKGVENKDEKIAALKRYFEPVIGQRLLKAETAMLKMEDGDWDDWFDLPIRLFFRSDEPISIAWSYFDRLFVSDGFSLPFDPAGVDVVWRAGRVSCLSILPETTLKSVSLGTGEMTWGEQEVEIWTRLVLGFGDGFMEIYNGLDENAFAFHETVPEGMFEKIC